MSKFVETNPKPRVISPWLFQLVLCDVPFLILVFRRTFPSVAALRTPMAALHTSLALLFIFLLYVYNRESPLAEKSTKLWGGRFSRDTDRVLAKWIESVTIDSNLVQEDIWGSIAHVTMLGRQVLNMTQLLILGYHPS